MGAADRNLTAHKYRMPFRNHRAPTGTCVLFNRSSVAVMVIMTSKTHKPCAISLRDAVFIELDAARNPYIY
jgi:hypothetical protein